MSEPASTARYEPAIGMECHAELLTASKMFCGCRNEFGGAPNTRCCPVCLGLPGALPVMNRTAVEHVIRTALALNCTVNSDARFDRKNYYYPDLPKGYQISEYDHPIGVRGWLDVELDGSVTRVHIRRVHLEEDTGKLSHGADGSSYVDFNRSGVPLMEIVTEFPPDIRSAEVARAYLAALRSVLTFIGVCDGRMEEGSLRCEPNVSVRPAGSDAYGTKTEIKNLNSFRAVQRGIAFECARQGELLDAGRPVMQETRGWNEARQATYPMRSKEVEQEYRYFPEPDLLPLDISSGWIGAIRDSMPELPADRARRFVAQYGLSPYDAGVLTATRGLADYYEAVAGESGDPRAAAVWVMGDLAALANEAGVPVERCPVAAGDLARMIALLRDGTVTGRLAKELLAAMYESGRQPEAIVAERGWKVMNDPEAVAAIVETVFAENHDKVADILVRGQLQKRGFLIGQVMKATGGQADPAVVNRMVDAKLDELR